MSLFESEVPVREVVTTDPERVHALDNEVRAKIVDMLATEEMAVEAVHAELAERGEEKAETTVRHHLDVLQDAGLVELSRLEEVGGGTRKYYRSNTRVFAYDLPEGADERLADAATVTRAGLSALLDSLAENHGDTISEVAAEMVPCEFCDTQHYEEFIVRELVNRALTDVAESGDLDERFA